MDNDTSLLLHSLEYLAEVNRLQGNLSAMKTCKDAKDKINDLDTLLTELQEKEV